MNLSQHTGELNIHKDRKAGRAAEPKTQKDAVEEVATAQTSELPAPGSLGKRGTRASAVSTPSTRIHVQSLPSTAGEPSKEEARTAAHHVAGLVRDNRGAAEVADELPSSHRRGSVSGRKQNSITQVGPGGWTGEDVSC